MRNINNVMYLRMSSVSLKEKFESHPVVWGLTLLVIGFATGFGASETVNLKLVGTNNRTGQVQCVIEGLDNLSKAHHERVMALQQEIVRLEAKASDERVLYSYQREYKEAAERLRDDVSTERAVLDFSLAGLALKCKNT